MITPFGDFGAKTSLTPIAGTDFLPLYNGYRKGSFSYQFALSNGSYKVNLKFVEPGMAPGQRVFSVLANGEALMENIDIAALTGGSLRALEKTLTVKVSDGKLDLDFRRIKGRRGSYRHLISSLSHPETDRRERRGR